ncbi:sensor histidine kinase [Paraburkholderia flava]|uniref:sensor histidine kinase n=1 Tax=Paraburkholderia flava TaxID=2547393 RepID=UPI00105F3B58|nr:histidine kinase [Paraburkholderia flava]
MPFASTFLSLRDSARSNLLARRLAYVLLLSCALGSCFWVVSRSVTLGSSLFTANAIGFSAFVFGRLLARLTGGRFAVAVRALIVAPLSVIVGTKLAALGGNDGAIRLLHSTPAQWIALAPTFLVVAIAYAFATVHIQSLQVRTALEKQRREAAELRQSETAARLALLQAQIEPHFLFNTLANVRSLIERDQAGASAMLDHLNRYLRASLGRTRKPVSSLEEELELIDALLSIAAMRLGDRLRYSVDLPHALRQLPLPPLLLQPLVENALIHGIEPAIEGGDIRIEIAREADMLSLAVIDTGVGLGKVSTLHGGVGLANVRARLAALYGDAARLSIESNATRGVTARLLLPLH